MDSPRAATQIESVAYEIEKVVGKQLVNGQLHYQVAVKGLSGPLWFPADALADSYHLVRKFERITAGSQGGNKSHGKSASKTNMAEIDHRFEMLVEGVLINQKLLAKTVPRITKLEDEMRVLKAEVRAQGQKWAAVGSNFGTRAGPSAPGVVTAASNGHIQGTVGAQQQQRQYGQGPLPFKLPCGKCGKFLTTGYIKRHLNLNKCGQRPGRSGKRGRQE